MTRVSQTNLLDQGRTAFDKLLSPATVCKGEEAEVSQCEDVEATELNGVEEREDRMAYEESTVKESWGRRASVSHAQRAACLQSRPLHPTV